MHGKHGKREKREKSEKREVREVRWDPEMCEPREMVAYCARW